MRLAWRRGIDEDRFWRMTPYQFFLAAKGIDDAQQDQMRKLAWHAANVMSMWSKKPIKPGRLLGEVREIPRGDDVVEHFRLRSLGVR